MQKNSKNATSRSNKEIAGETTPGDFFDMVSRENEEEGEGDFFSESDEERLVFDVPNACTGVRIDAFLADVSDFSRSAVVRLLEEGRVHIVGADGVLRKNTRLEGGESIAVEIPAPVPAQAQPENIPLDIVYEDCDMIVVNKPTGMVVHPAPGNLNGTLVNALLWHCGSTLSGIGGVIRPGIVHRIDKDTSGLLVVAKNDDAHRNLAAQIKIHAVRRVYTAIVLGGMPAEEGTLNFPIGRNPVDRKKMAILTAKDLRARGAVTHYRVRERYAGFTLLSCSLETGRTHQIRVHLSGIGHPILGDPLYGGDKSRFQTLHKALIHGQCLHAGELSLHHPRTGEEMTFHAPLPPDTEKIIAILRGLAN